VRSRRVWHYGRGYRVRLVANDKYNILRLVVKRTLVPLDRTAGPPVAEKPRIEVGAKFVRDGLGDSKRFR